MKKIKLLKNNSGFTLVELIVVMALITVVTGVVYQLFATASRYTQSVALMNEYQSITTDAIYRLRVELADRAYVESFDAADTETDGTLKYDPANLDANYGYIVVDPVVVNADGTSSGGGVTVKGISIDSLGNIVRNADEVIGKTDDKKPYRVQISFRSEDTGRTNIGVSIVRTDYQNPTTGDYEAKTVYTQSTTMMLRSGKPSTGQTILRYGVAA